MQCDAGMGVFEYFQLAEAVGAEPVWVINNGIAHEDSVPAAQIWPLVQVPAPTHKPLSQEGHASMPAFLHACVHQDSKAPLVSYLNSILPIQQAG